MPQEYEKLISIIEFEIMKPAKLICNSNKLKLILLKITFKLCS